jgi:hypothetical protein
MVKERLDSFVGLRYNKCMKTSKLIRDIGFEMLDHAAMLACVLRLPSVGEKLRLGAVRIMLGKSHNSRPPICGNANDR